MNIEFIPLYNEAIINQSIEEGIEARKILNDLGIKYIISVSKYGNATIKFYKDSQCIESEYLLTGDKIQVNFCLYKHASRFKYRDKFKTVEENDFLTEILLDLTYKLEIQTISHHNN